LVPVFEDFPRHGFPAIARGAPILLAFLQFGCPFGTLLLSGFFTPFFRAAHIMAFIGGLLEGPGDFGDDFGPPPILVCAIFGLAFSCFSAALVRPNVLGTFGTSQTFQTFPARLILWNF
jgi:hypothetical protein